MIKMYHKFVDKTLDLPEPIGLTVFMSFWLIVLAPVFLIFNWIAENYPLMLLMMFPAPFIIFVILTILKKV